MTAAGAPDAVAIVGMACRFPGSDGPAELWDALLSGRDPVGPVPAERFDIDGCYDPVPRTPGKICARGGGFITGVDRFDAGFFGVSRREAERMDPQQRIALEVAWEAFEDAGIAIDRLADLRTGVFAALGHSDYAHPFHASWPDHDLHSLLGTAPNAAPGRISHLLGLRGPSLAVDASHASSLVAVHLARQSLASGDCELAVVCAANLVLSPATSIAYSQGMLSPDARCKAFDATANGIVRSDGAGAIVLRPLHAALAAGDRVYAVIRASAIHHDGDRAPLCTQRAEGWEAVLRIAYQRAGVDPWRVQYVEAHGAGIADDDAAEIAALDAVLCGGRSPDHPLRVGSVKTNIGHAEAAAGMAGLLKTVLALHHGTIPGNLHFTTPSPRIAWDRMPIAVPTSAIPWPDTAGEPAVAGVSSAGMSGTNTHVVLEGFTAGPAADRAPAAYGGRPYLFAASARSDQALGELVARHRAALAGTAGVALRDLCYAAGARRWHGGARLGIVARSTEELTAQLAKAATGEPSAAVLRGRASEPPGRLAFVFSGQGSQWLGMARGLMDEPVFRAAVERCDREVRALLGWSVIDQLFADPAGSRLDDIDVVQPAIFAFQVALVELLGTWGVRPDAVVGHSLGEITAAHVAGVLSLHDAARIVCARSRVCLYPCVQGGMAVIALPASAVEDLITPWRGRVWIAIHESPESTAISGEPAALDAVIDEVLRREVFGRRVKAPVAGHSPMFDPVREPLLALIDGIDPRPARTWMQSTVELGLDARTAGAAAMGSGFWWRNLREPVLFAEAMRALIAEGVDAFFEISPHPILCRPMQQCGDHAGVPITALPSARRNIDERTALLSALASLYTRGRSPDWTAICDGPAPPVRLPHTPWQRERYWFAPSSRGEVAGAVRDDIDGLRLEPLDAPRGADGGAGDRHRAAGTPHADRSGRRAMLAELLTAGSNELAPWVEAVLTEHIAEVIGRPTIEIHPEASLDQLGLDSLMALEFRNRIRADFDVVPPLARLVLSDASLRMLGREVIEQLAARPPAGHKPAARGQAHHPGIGLGTDDLTEDQILALLREIDGEG